MYKNINNNKMLLVLLCIKLSLIFFCVPVFSNCISEHDYFLSNNIFANNDTIHVLVSDNDIASKLLINEFQRQCDNFYDIYIIKNTCNNSVEATIEAINLRFQNVINLNVPDYDNYNGISLEANHGLIYAGEHKNGTKDGDRKFDKNKTHVKLVSSTVADIDYGYLYNFIQHLEYVNGDVYSGTECSGVVENSKLDTILVCENFAKTSNDVNIFKTNDVNVRTLTIDCIDAFDIYKNKLLAVLTPEPFDFDYEVTVPIIFYESPYMLPEYQSLFPNSLVLSNWHILKNEILKFLLKADWSRVAIITDDSIYNIQFEEGLTKLFRENNIVYAVKRCEELICDFKNTMKSLEEENAKIVIGNFDAKYATQISMYATRSYNWIVHDWPSSTTWPYKLGTAYSFKLTGARERTSKIVKSVYDTASTINPDIYDRNEFFEILTNKVKKSIPVKNQEVVIKMMKSGRAEAMQSFELLKKQSGLVGCVFRSNEYTHPCEDVLLLVISLVFTIFTVTFIAIIIYFGKSSPLHRLRYRQL